MGTMGPTDLSTVLLSSLPSPPCLVSSKKAQPGQGQAWDRDTARHKPGLLVDTCSNHLHSTHISPLRGSEAWAGTLCSVLGKWRQ